MISADPAVLIPGSGTRQRMREYAGLFDELHIVVLTREHGGDAEDENLFLYRAAGRTLPIRMLRAWRVGLSCAAGRRPGIISSQGADETGALGWLLSRRFGIPFQLQLHTDVMSSRYRRAGWKEYVRYLLARFLIPRADCVRVVSERIRQSLVSQFPVPSSQFRVLPIFTDVSKFVTAAPDQETERRFAGYDFKIIAVGRFVDREKNFSMLIDAMREFLKICPNALLVMVGEGTDRENYKLQITNYKLEKHIMIEPWRDDLASFYKLFDLFVSASNYEGWGRAVIEAMAAGLPIIMTDTGLAGEVVKNQENGVVVPVGDARAFFQAIRELYEQPEKRKHLATAGRQTAQNLRPATRAEYLARYRQCLESYVSAHGAT